MDKPQYLTSRERCSLAAKFSTSDFMSISGLVGVTGTLLPSTRDELLLSGPSSQMEIGRLNVPLVSDVREGLRVV